MKARIIGLRQAFWLAVLLILPIHSGCSRNADESEDVPVSVNVEVETARVELGEIREIIQANGTLTALPNQDVKVSALVPGRVADLLAIEGDSVSKGSIIARLDASTFEDQLRQGKATLENAQLHRERCQRLFDRGISARKEVEDAEKDLEVAQAGFDTARIQLSRTEIRSPISGVLVKRFTSVGEQVDGTSSQPIAEVANYDPVELVANVQVSFLAYIKEGQIAEVRTDAFGSLLFEGKVISVLPSIDSATNTATVRIRIPNGDHRLRGGMFAAASIIAAVHNHALCVPASALLSSSEPTIFVVGPNSVVEQRHIRIGWRDGDKVEILENAKQGETVVTTGSYGLADKMKVTIKRNLTTVHTPS